MKKIDRSKDSLLRLPAVMRRTGLVKAAVYRKMAAGEFPPSVSIGTNMVAWYESDIDAWVAAPLEWRMAA